MESPSEHLMSGQAVDHGLLLPTLRSAAQAIGAAYESEQVLQTVAACAPQLAGQGTCLLVAAGAGPRLLAAGSTGQQPPATDLSLPADILPADLFSVAAPRSTRLPAGVWLPVDQPPLPTTLITLPLLVHDEPFAALLLYTDAPPDDSLLLALELLLSQAASALANSRLLADTYERERFHNALARVSLATSATLDQGAVLDLICQESMTTFGVDGVYIWQRHGEELRGTAAQGAGRRAFIGRTVGLDTPYFSARVARSGEAQFLNEFSPGGDVGIQLPLEDNVRAVLGIPLFHEEAVIGTLMLVDTTGRHQFSPRDVAQALQFGGQAAIAIQNAQLVRELRTLNEQLDERVAQRTAALAAERDRVQFLLRVAAELAASLDEDRVLTRALEMVNEVIQADQGVILLPDADRRLFRIRARNGRDVALPAGGIESSIRLDQGLAGWILQQRRSVVVDDVRRDPRWLPGGENSPPRRSALGVPLVSGEEAIGVLMFFHHAGGAFSQEQLALVEAVAYQVANAIGNAQLYFFIQEQAEQIGGMLREEQKEAAKSEAILASLADGLLVADDGGSIVVANHAVRRILDHPRSSLIGRSLVALLADYGGSQLESLPEQIAVWSRAADRRQPRGYISDELHIEGRTINVRLSPVYDTRDFLGTVATFRDVTPEREADRAKSEFVSNVSHELRTPMTSIKGYTDLLLMGAAGEMGDAQRHYLQVIKNNADRLKLLVDDLLDISRIETGKTRVERRPLNLRTLIDDVVDGHLRGRTHSEGRAMGVTVDVAPDLPPVPADKEKVTRILTNLVDNAFNYTEGEGQITIRARRTGRSVTVDVADTGIGIAPDVIDHIFDRFYRAEEAQERMVPGTGLGLAIVRSLVQMHGGQLTVASTPGVGSTFSFDLPLEGPDGAWPADGAAGQ